jgi:hypothetical protein
VPVRVVNTPLNFVTVTLILCADAIVRSFLRIHETLPDTVIKVGKFHAFAAINNRRNALGEWLKCPNDTTFFVRVNAKKRVRVMVRAICNSRYKIIG